MESINENSHVLYLWQENIKTSLEENVKKLKAIKNVTVNVENVERILLGKQNAC